MVHSMTGQDHQPFPSKGKLAGGLNTPLSVLRQRVGAEEATVYSYVVRSIENEGGNFVQTGSAPNFQGDLITLCTCKHQMRTYRSPYGWEGLWIAGFTSVGIFDERNALVYLTRIAHAFESHHDLWYSQDILETAKQAKSARSSRYGDLFQPLERLSDPFDPRDYYQPCSGHSHCGDNSWHGDVNYAGRSGRKAALLAGRPGA